MPKGNGYCREQKGKQKKCTQVIEITVHQGQVKTVGTKLGD